MDSELNLEQFALKVLAIQALYAELCQIANISPEQYPLTIIQLEAGSLLSELSGIPKIIDLMDKLITDSISFLHRSFTREGKISQIPRSVEKIEYILHLRNELRDAGFETLGLDEQINKSSVIIAKNLNVLLLKEAKVVVNRKEYSLNKEQTQKYIEEGKKLALPSPPKIYTDWEEEQQ